MKMKFYGFPTSNVQRAALPLYLIDVDVEKELELVKVNLMAHEQHSPAYKSKQIFGVVPCLEDDGVVIFESRAIARYFVEKYGAERKLLGETLKERAIVDTWMQSEAQNFHPTVGPVVREVVMSRVMKKPENQELISERLRSLGTVLDAYEGHLSRSKYLAGDRYTLADALHTPYMEKVRSMEVFQGMLESRPHVAAWVSEITSLPAFQRCMQMNWEKASPLQ